MCASFHVFGSPAIWRGLFLMLFSHVLSASLQEVKVLNSIKHFVKDYHGEELPPGYLPQAGASAASPAATATGQLWLMVQVRWLDTPGNIAMQLQWMLFAVSSSFIVAGTTTTCMSACCFSRSGVSSTSNLVGPTTAAQSSLLCPNPIYAPQ